MTDPERIHDDAAHVVLHAWVTLYLRSNDRLSPANMERFSERMASQAVRLRESALLLQAALDKMRLANERLAARMAEHKAFFAKYETPE